MSGSRAAPHILTGAGGEMPSGECFRLGTVGTGSVRTVTVSPLYARAHEGILDAGCGVVDCTATCKGDVMQGMNRLKE